MNDEIRIVVVDDDHGFCQLLELVLRRAGGLEVVGIAHDGSAAVEQARSLEPDVVLLDLRMPGMDGFEALPLIHAACPTTSVIVLTALEADEASSEGFLVGAAGFVEKRHVNDRLEQAIRSCVSVET